MLLPAPSASIAITTKTSRFDRQELFADDTFYRLNETNNGLKFNFDMLVTGTGSLCPREAQAGI